MRKAGVVFRRELGSYFRSPIAYVVIAAFMALAGYFFSIALFATRLAEMAFTFGNLSVVLLFVAPIITLKALVDERRTGTDELLLTAPLSVPAIVVGKFLAAVGIFVAMLVVSLIFPFILGYLGSPDPGPILTGYLGLFLLGSALLAAGIFSSSLTQDPVVAGMIGFAMMLLLWSFSWIAGALPGVWGQVVSALALVSRFDTFMRGVVDLVDVLFYLSYIFVFLFLTVRVVDKRRWS